jgi:hypothetical protein
VRDVTRFPSRRRRALSTKALVALSVAHPMMHARPTTFVGDEVLKKLMHNGVAARANLYAHAD